jgi:hypothetical protein
MYVHDVPTIPVPAGFRHRQTDPVPIFRCEVKPADHFAAFCATLTQSEDVWEVQPFTLEARQRRFWREALKDWRSVVLLRRQAKNPELTD